MSAECNSKAREDNESVKKFELLRLELEKAPSTRIVEVIKNFKVEDIKTWTKDQWSSVLVIVETKISSIQQVLSFVEWIQPLITKTGAGVHLLALVFVLKLVLRLSSNLQETKQSVIQGSSVKELTLLGLRILADSKLSLVKSLTVEEYDLLGKVLVLLSEISTQKSSFFDIKIILEIWKSFADVFTVYIKRTKQSGRNINNLKNVLQSPVAYLLQEVGRNISLIHRVQALQQPIEQVDKYLRVTNFYLRILRQLIAETKHKDFVAAKDFFESHKQAKFLPKHLIGTEIAKLLEKYVENSFDSLLSYVYKNPDILKCLLLFIHENEDSQAYTLIETYLSAITSNDDGNFIETITPDLIKIFEICFKNPKIRLDPFIYDAIITQFSAMTMLEEAPTLLNYLRKNILKDDFWVATASADVLILLQRYQHEHMEQFSDALMQELNFWQDCYSKFSLFSSDLKQINILRLFRNCLQLCSSNRQLLTFPNAAKKNPENYRLLLATDWSEDFEKDASSLNSVLYQSLKQLTLGSATVDCYYKTIAYMQLSESLHIPLNEKTINILGEITERLLSCDKTQWEAFSLFLKISLKLISTFGTGKLPRNAEKFLNEQNTERGMVMFPELINIMRFFSKGSTLQVQCKSVDSSDDMSLESIADVIEQISTQKYHSCLKNHSPEEPLSKRKCLDFKY